MGYTSNLISIGFSNDKVPAFQEKRGAEYIKYGEENNYPEFLLTLFNRSAIHNSISTSKQFYIAGKGFTFDQTNMDPKDIVKLQAFLDQPNPYETLNDLLNKVVLDEELFGGFYLHGIYDKIKKNLVELYHVDYNTVRSNKDNSEFYISEEWLNEDGTENTKPEFERKPAYNPDPNVKQKEFIFYFKSYRPGLKTYTLPSYIGGVEAIITDCEIANFHRASIQNGFVGSKMITFMNGVPADEEMKATEKKMKKKFTGTDNAGKFVIDFVDDPLRAAKVENLGDDQFDKKYDALDKTVEGKIFKSHKITSPILFGVTTPGALGQRNELVDAFNIFSNTYIQPKQQLHERVMNIFAPVKGKLKIQPVEPIIPTFSDQTLMDILTKDEMRGIIGRKPLDAKTDLNNTIVDALNALSPLVANKVLNTLTQNEIRSIVNKDSIPGGDTIPVNDPKSDPAVESMVKQIRARLSAQNFSSDDNLDYSVFSKYGEPVEKFETVKIKKQIFTTQQFKLTPTEQGILDLVKKTPDITKESLQEILKSDKTAIDDALENLVGEGLIKVSDSGITITKSGGKTDVPTFTDIFIRYRYVLRSDAPPLQPGSKSRPFCEAMMSNPRYFSKNEIEMIGQELGSLYGISDYDAFRRRGGWYHDPQSDVNVPFCRHIWQQELVKKIK